MCTRCAIVFGFASQWSKKWCKNFKLKEQTSQLMNQSEFLGTTCNSFKVQQNSHVQGAIGFTFAFHPLKNLCAIFKKLAIKIM